jgi:hypothetical protein
MFRCKRKGSGRVSGSSARPATSVSEDEKKAIYVGELFWYLDEQWIREGLTFEERIQRRRKIERDMKRSLRVWPQIKTYLSRILATRKVLVGWFRTALHVLNHWRLL